MRRMIVVLGIVSAMLMTALPVLAITRGGEPDMATFEATTHPLAFAHMEGGVKTVFVVPWSQEFSVISSSPTILGGLTRSPINIRNQFFSANRSGFELQVVWS